MNKHNASEGFENLEPPLLAAFLELMAMESGQAHRGVDLESYLLLVDTIRSGYGLTSKEDLLFICKKLWLKPFHVNNPVVNDQVLTKVVERNLASYESATLGSKADGERPGDVTMKEKAAEKKSGDAGEMRSTKKDDANVLQTNPDITNTETGTVSLLVTDYTGEESAHAGEKEKHNQLFSSKPFVLDKKYLPVSQRFIEQTTRSLRVKSKGVGIAVIDVASTVEEVAKTGFVSDWVRTEEDGFVTRWTLMIDVGGSMSPFQDISDAMVSALKNGNMKNEGDIFYFKNYTTNNLFVNTAHTRAVTLRKLQDGPSRQILIISDAGAAKGLYREERVDRTYQMLHHLRRHRIAWLNPMPTSRWEGTSAEEIASFVRMFEVGNDNSDSMANIVHVLKARKIA